jgi:quercetin dioxygenase-like cupin family protein
MKANEVEVIKWSGEETLSEESIRHVLAAEDLHPYRWSNAAGDVYSTHTHGYHKVIYVVRGSITFGLPGTGDQVELHAGDRLELPADTAHNAVVGSHGVVCLEAHR